MTQIPFPRTIADLRPGDHLCCIYDSEEEHRAVLTPFLRHGLERGEKVLYIVDARTARTILDYLRDDGLDAEPCLARGQLVILTRDDAYTRDGVFDPDGMIALLRTETERSLTEGYSALRVTGEMTWALRGLPGSERLMEYENRLNEFFPGSQCLAFCQYDRRRFDPAVLLDVLATHPIAVIGTEVYDNFYYVPPAEQLKGDPAAAMLRNWVKHLAERRQAEAALREQTHELDERVKELNCLYGISKLVEAPGIPLDQILQGTADLLSPAWRYPEAACARIVLGDQEFKTENFRETPWRQTCDIKAHGQPIGGVEVCYLEERPESDEGPFLEEERSLINAVAERLGRIVERRRAEEALRERTRELVDMPGISLEQMLQRAVGLIPPSWQYSEVACARIVLEDQEFKTDNFSETPWRQAADIRLRGERIGTVEVCYLVEKPDSDEGPFLKEERSLISAVAERLSRIVEVKRAEDEIQAERQRLSVLVETSPVGVFVVEAESGRVSFLNREARRILGFPREPEGRMEWRELVAVYRRPDGRAYTVEELPTVRALYRGERVSAEEVLVEFADGRTIFALVNATPVYSSERRVRGAITVIQDITPLEEAAKVRSEFLGMVSHELRTPLTAIKGAAATVLGSPSPIGAQETRELFQVIDEQADRIRDLVSNLLDMTRIEAGRLSVSPEPTDLRAILDEARATFMRSGSPQVPEIRMLDDLPPVNADRGRIAQVLVNLLTNAAKLSPPTAPILVEVERDELSAKVHVRDQGRGIAKEKLHRLFKKFTRLHEDEGQTLSGTGLGLAICKGIVEAHGGRIWAESAGEGWGATFSFTIPIASEVSVTSLSDAARGAVHLRKVTRRGERTRVLAVDDEPQILRYFERTLSQAGYEAIVTDDPSQVAGLVETEEPDLILLDLIIPGTSGFDLLQQIREFSSVPVIIVTGSEREEDTVQALKLGADDYVTKPFSPTELFARMEVALRRRVSPDLLEERPPLVLGDLSIDFAERRVTVGGHPISLSATEYKLLYELATHVGRVLTHDQLLQRVWGSEYEGETGLLRSFIVLVRRKLGDDARHPRFIFTEPGVGYRMPRP
jgi:PAS domain S-box-containing protein